MSSTVQSKSADKQVKSPVENIASKNECEVSSSDKVNDLKAVQNPNEGTKENTAVVSVPQKITSSNDNMKPDSKLETKMSSESTNRNPLTESASIPSNNDSNRKSSNGGENKAQKTPANVQNEANNNNNNNPKLRTRPAKKSTSPTPMSACGWCSDSKPALNYILPTLSGENLQFCSEMCIGEFRKAVKKGACKQCGNVAKYKDFCSLYCMSKAMPKNGTIPNVQRFHKIY